MNLEQKQKLLADVRRASRALGQIVDGGHDLSRLPSFNAANAERLKASSLDTLAGLALLEAILAEHRA